MQTLNLLRYVQDTTILGRMRQEVNVKVTPKNGTQHFAPENASTSLIVKEVCSRHDVKTQAL